MADKKKPRVVGREHTGRRNTRITKDGTRIHDSYVVTESFLSNGKSSFTYDKDLTVDSVTDERDKPRRGARYGLGKGNAIASNFAGGMLAVASSLFAMYIFVLLSRAYNHLPFIGVYDALILLGNGAVNPIANGISTFWSGFEKVVGTLKWSWQTILPDSWAGFATVLDYTVNFNYIIITVIQVFMSVLRILIQLISVIYGFGNFVTSMATSGNGWWASTESYAISNAREELWNMLIS